MNKFSLNFSKFLPIKYFLLISGIYLLWLLVLVLVKGYVNSFTSLNAFHFPFLDLPMFIITHFGDSLILTSIICFLFVKKYPNTVMVVIVSVIITGLFGQILKVTFFEGWDRPLKTFDESLSVYVLPNYKLFHNSFPSGHSITASTALTALMLSFKPRKIYQVITAVLLIVISYSRVYLGVHFPGDVLAGSFIGITLMILLFPLLEKVTQRLHYSKSFIIGMMLIALIGLVSGIWMLRQYSPL